jgi:hypothetical protein
MEGKNLLIEEVHEHERILKKITITAGLVLISITTIPTLYMYSQEY